MMWSAALQCEFEPTSKEVIVVNRLESVLIECGWKFSGVIHRIMRSQANRSQYDIRVEIRPLNPKPTHYAFMSQRAELLIFFTIDGTTVHFERHYFLAEMSVSLSFKRELHEKLYPQIRHLRAVPNIQEAA